MQLSISMEKNWIQNFAHAFTYAQHDVEQAPVATNAKQSYLFLLLTSPVPIGKEKDTHQLICPSYCPAPLPLMSAPTTNQALQQNPNSQTHHGEKNFQILEKDPFHVHNL